MFEDQAPGCPKSFGSPLVANSTRLNSVAPGCLCCENAISGRWLSTSISQPSHDRERQGSRRSRGSPPGGRRRRRAGAADFTERSVVRRRVVGGSGVSCWSPAARPVPSSSIYLPRGPAFERSPPGFRPAHIQMAGAPYYAVSRRSRCRRSWCRGYPHECDDELFEVGDLLAGRPREPSGRVKQGRKNRAKRRSVISTVRRSLSSVRRPSGVAIPRCTGRSIVVEAQSPGRPAPGRRGRFRPVVISTKPVQIGLRNTTIGGVVMGYVPYMAQVVASHGARAGRWSE